MSEISPKTFKETKIHTLKFWSFHGGDVSIRGLLGCDTVYCYGGIPTIRRSMPLPSSR